MTSIKKPAWYEHTLRNERGEVVNTIIADHEGPAFGKPDVNYDKLFTVTVVPLYYPDEVERLRAKLIKINELIFAAGAPLGGDVYFQIRELCAEELRKTSAITEPEVKS